MARRYKVTAREDGESAENAAQMTHRHGRSDIAEMPRGKQHVPGAGLEKTLGHETEETYRADADRRAVRIGRHFQCRKRHEPMADAGESAERAVRRHRNRGQTQAADGASRDHKKPPAARRLPQAVVEHQKRAGVEEQVAESDMHERPRQHPPPLARRNARRNEEQRREDTSEEERRVHEGNQDDEQNQLSGHPGLCRGRGSRRADDFWHCRSLLFGADRAEV